MLEKAMATHSSTLAWKIPWTKEPGRLQSMGSLRFGHDWVTSLSLFTFTHWRRKWEPTPAWRIPGMVEPGGLPSMGSHRVGHDWSDLAAAAAAYHSRLLGTSRHATFTCMQVHVTVIKLSHVHTLSLTSLLFKFFKTNFIFWTGITYTW